MRPLVLTTFGCLLGCVGSRGTVAQTEAPPRVPERSLAGATVARKLDRVVEIGVGTGHACARRDDGSVWCWGHNGGGALARVDIQQSAVAVRIEGLPPAVELVVGDDASCVFDAERNAWCWGTNYHGELDGDPRRTPIPDWHSVAFCGVGNDGKGRVDGDNVRFSPVEVAHARGAGRLAFGMDFTCATMADGIACWGSDEYGVVRGDGSDGFTRGRVAIDGPVAVAAASTYACAVDAPGRTWCWGIEQIDGEDLPPPSPPHVVAGLPAATDVAFLGDSACVRARDGATWCWGGDPDADAQSDRFDVHRPIPARLEPGFDWSRFRFDNGYACTVDDGGAIACEYDGARTSVERIPDPVVALDGSSASCALTSAGEVWCFSIHDYRVMVPDWAGLGGEAVPVMLELDLAAAPELPPGALAGDRAGPPTEARQCTSTRGTCEHEVPTRQRMRRITALPLSSTNSEFRNLDSVGRTPTSPRVSSREPFELERWPPVPWLPKRLTHPCGRGACTPASSTAGADLLRAPPGSCERAALVSFPASRPRPSR